MSADIATLGIRVDSRPVEQASNSLDRLTNSGRAAERQTEGVTKSMGGLRNALAALGLGAAIREIAGYTDQYKQLNAQLDLATANYGNLGKAQTDVRNISRETRSELAATASLYGNFIRQAQTLNITQGQAGRATETFTKTLKISGAGASEAAAATLQFSQALASGVFRGDEFNSVAENSPRLLKLLADSLRTSTGALRNMAAEGKLTASVLKNALIDPTLVAGIDAEFKKLPTTFGQVFDQIKNSAVLTFGAFDQGGEFSNDITSFGVHFADTMSSMEDRAEEAGIEFRSSIEGVAEAFAPLTDATETFFGYFAEMSGATTYSFKKDLHDIFGQIDSFTKWLGQQGILGKAIAGGGSNLQGDFDAKQQSRELFLRSQAETRRNAASLGDDHFSKFVDRGGTGSMWESDFIANPAPVDKNAAKKYESLVKASQKYVDQLNFERKTIGAGTIELISMNAAREAAKAPTDALSSAIIASAQALTDETLAYEANAAIQAAFAEQNEKNREAKEKSRLASADLIEQMKYEASLIGLTTEERAKATAAHELEAKGIDMGTDAYRRYMLQAGLVSKLKVKNNSLDEFNDEMQSANKNIQTATDNFGKFFGTVGRGFANLVSVLSDYKAKSVDINTTLAKSRNDYLAGLKTTDELNDAERKATLDRRSLDLTYYGDVTAAAKSFFKEKSTGYKVLEGAEKAFRAIELAMSIKSMAQSAIETVAKVIAHTTAAAAAGSEAMAVTAASLPFPFNLGAMGVMAAALASVGVITAFSGGGGGSAAKNAQTRQDAQGSGSVLGDVTAKSDSIAKSLEIAAGNSNKDLEYSNEMVKSLRNIENGISSLASLAARQLGLSTGAFSTDGLGIGSSKDIAGNLGGASALLGVGGFGIAGAFAGMLIPEVIKLATKIPVVGGAIGTITNALFGKKVTTSVNDQGLDFASGSVGDILNGGIDASTYQELLTKTKKKFLGISSSKTSTSTVSTANEDLSNQVGLLVGSLRDSIVSASHIIGADSAAAMLDAFQVDIGKISLKDMTGDEIEAALNAVFSKLGDDMAAAVVPGLSALQDVGEGTFETLVRLAKEYTVVDVAMKSIGRTFGAVGLSSIEARDNLVKLFGGIEDFMSATDYFADNFLSQSEKMAPIFDSVRSALSGLGLGAITTKDQFKDAVEGLDLTTQAGRDLYKSLMDIAPAFVKITEYLEDLQSTVASATENLTKAYKAEVDALQDVVDAQSTARDALTDAYERETSAIQATADKFKAFVVSFAAFRRELSTGSLASLSPENGYNALRDQFNDISAKAATGDVAALNDLQSVSEAYLQASKAYYASSQGYFDDLAKVKLAVIASELYAADQVDVAQESLNQLNAMVAGVIDVRNQLLSVYDVNDQIFKITGENNGVLIGVYDGVGNVYDALGLQKISIEEVNQTVADVNAAIGREMAAALENSKALADTLASASDAAAGAVGAAVSDGAASTALGLASVATTVAGAAAGTGAAIAGAAASTTGAIGALSSTNAAAMAANGLLVYSNGVAIVAGSKATTDAIGQSATTTATGLDGVGQTVAVGTGGTTAAVNAGSSASVAATLTASALTSLGLSTVANTTSAGLTDVNKSIATTSVFLDIVNKSIASGNNILGTVGANVGGVSYAIDQNSGAIVAKLGETLVGFDTVAGAINVGRDHTLAWLSAVNDNIAAGDQSVTNAVVSGNGAINDNIRESNRISEFNAGMIGQVYQNISGTNGAIGAVYSATVSVKDALAGFLTAQQAASEAQAQLDALNKQVSGLLVVNNSVLSVKDAIDALTKANADYAAAVLASKTTVNVTTTAATPAPAADQFAYGGDLYNQAAAYNLSEKAIGHRVVDYSQWYRQNPDAFRTDYERTKATGSHIFFMDAYVGMTPGTAAQIATELGLPQFAQGGVFTNGVVSQPTNFDMGQMGEDGPEAIVPLVRGPKGLGVRTSGANNEEVVKALNEVRDELRAANFQRGVAAVNANEKLSEVVEGLDDVKRQLQK